MSMPLLSTVQHLSRDVLNHARSRVAIAQIVFYVPAVALQLILCCYSLETLVLQATIIAQ